MITLPAPFTRTKYPGYFWHKKEQKLYSIKITGELRTLKCRQPNPFSRMTVPYYTVSVKGNRRVLCVDYLKGLKIQDSVIAIAK